MHFPLPCDNVQSPSEYDSVYFNEERMKLSRFSCYQSPVHLACQNLWQLMKLVFASAKFYIFHILSNNRLILIQKKHSISNSLFSLINEATRMTSHELWISSENTQLAFLKIFGSCIDVKIKNVSYYCYLYL